MFAEYLSIHPLPDTASNARTTAIWTALSECDSPPAEESSPLYEVMRMRHSILELTVMAQKIHEVPDEQAELKASLANDYWKAAFEYYMESRLMGIPPEKVRQKGVNRLTGTINAVAEVPDIVRKAGYNLLWAEEDEPPQDFMLSVKRTPFHQLEQILKEVRRTKTPPETTFLDLMKDRIPQFGSSNDAVGETNLADTQIMLGLHVDSPAFYPASQSQSV